MCLCHNVGRHANTISGTEGATVVCVWNPLNGCTLGQQGPTQYNLCYSNQGKCGYRSKYTAAVGSNKTGARKHQLCIIRWVTTSQVAAQVGPNKTDTRSRWGKSRPYVVRAEIHVRERHFGRRLERVHEPISEIGGALQKHPVP